MAEAQGSRPFTVAMPSLDGATQVTAQLQEHPQDAAHPPALLALAHSPLSIPRPPHQVPPTHVILSTGSGHGKAESFFHDVVAPILDLVHPGGTKAITLHTTTSANSILELTRDLFLGRANHGHAQRIILASGDGGIVDLVNGLSPSDTRSERYVAPTIILLPLGTANALYHSINATTTGAGPNTWGLGALSSTMTKPLPTFSATFSPGARLVVDEARAEAHLPPSNALSGAVVVSWGMHASLVADSDTAEYRKFGIDRFKMAAKEALYPADGAMPHAYRGRVSILPATSTTTTTTTTKDWVSIGDQHLYTLATLVSHLEAPFCISPRSKPLDGSLHLVHFGPTSGDEAMRIMGLAYQGGKHVDDDMVRYEAIEALKIEFDDDDARWRRVCVDGKIVRVEKGGWVDVRLHKGGAVASVAVID
ncbi:hypothetical protein ACEQ8H_004563 [Pleosporales sp. CAS-2024a]